MANKLYEEASVQAIAEKIREKANTNTTYKLTEMPNGIDAVYAAGQAAGGSGGGGIVPAGVININENGTYDVTNYASAVVEVASSGGSSFRCGTVNIGNNADGTAEQMKVVTTFEVDIGVISDVRSINLFYAGKNTAFSVGSGWNIGWYGNHVFNEGYRTVAAVTENISVLDESATHLRYDQTTGKLYATATQWCNVICGTYVWIVVTGGDL